MLESNGANNDPHGFNENAEHSYSTRTTVEQQHDPHGFHDDPADHTKPPPPSLKSTHDVDDDEVYSFEIDEDTVVRNGDGVSVQLPWYLRFRRVFTRSNLFSCLVRLVQFTFLSMTSMILGILYWVFFSMVPVIGQGDKVYLTLASDFVYFVPIASVSLVLLLLLATFDVGYWNGIYKYLGFALMLLDLIGFIFTGLAFTYEFPAISLCVFIACCPIFLILCRISVYRFTETKVFLFDLSLSLFVVSMITLFVWLNWVIAYEHVWNVDTQIDFYIRLNCINASEAHLGDEENRTQLIARIDDIAGCEEAFLLWVSPIILSVFTFLISLSIWFVMRARKSLEKNKQSMDTLSQVFLFILALFFLGMWIAAGIAGAEMGLSNVVFSFSFLFLIIGGTTLVVAAGARELYKDLMRATLARSLQESGDSDWFRALGLVVLGPFLLLLAPLSRVRQLGRRHVSFTKNMDERESMLYFSVEFTRILARTRNWSWTSVITKAIYWGLAFFLLTVVCARVLNVFFSFLNDQFIYYEFGLWEVSLAFTACASLAFQFPPTPGLPIYYASGVIVTRSALEEGWDFWGGWALATLIALICKFGAIVTVQMIGQCWGAYSVWIRKTVQVNSQNLRAMRYILMQRGMTVHKVAILVGGPDWPVAIVCGILRTSYVQNVVGALPAIFLVMPISLAGAFILQTGTNALYGSLAAIALSVAVLFQGISILCAMHFVQDVTLNKRDEIAEFPVDEQVARADLKDALNMKFRNKASQFGKLPHYLQVILLVGLVLETFSLYLFLLFGKRCFVPFEVTNSIAVTLGGNVLNLVRPLGWAGLFSMMGGMVSTIVLGRWISCQPKHSEEEVEGIGGEAPSSSVTSTTAGGVENSDDEALARRIARVMDEEAAAAENIVPEDDAQFAERYSKCFGACMG